MKFTFGYFLCCMAAIFFYSGCQSVSTWRIVLPQSETKAMEISYGILKNLRLSCIDTTHKEIQSFQIFFGDSFGRRMRLCGTSQNKHLQIPENIQPKTQKKDLSRHDELLILLSRSFWFQIPDHETIGLSVRKVLNEEKVRQTKEYCLTIPENQKYLIDFTPLLSSLPDPQEVRVAVWRHEGALFYYSQAVISENNTAELFLTPEQEYILFLYYRASENKYVYHYQTWVPGDLPKPVDEYKTFTVSHSEKPIARVYPARDFPIHPSRNECTDDLLASLDFALSPFATEPRNAIFCAFYETCEDAELFGPPGTITFSAAGTTNNLDSNYRPKPFELKVHN